MNYFDYLYSKKECTASDEIETPISECSAKGGPENCRYHSKFVENEGVRSYVTKALNKGTASKPKWVEVKKDAKGNSLKDDHSEWMKKGKHDKWYALKDPKEIAETPNLDSFADVEKIEATVMSLIPNSVCYVRSNESIGEDGNKNKMYKWTKGGVEVSEEEARRLEGALREAGYTSAVNPDYTNVSVRPDIYSGYGQMTQYTNKSGEVHNDYCSEHKQDSSIEKYKNVNKLLKVYDKIKDKIFSDCDKGKEEAILAYFMMRTKIRAGSKKDPSAGRGATDLERGDFTLSDDGETFYVSFNGKSKQWWHVTCKDKFLYDYIKSRKGSISGVGANDESIFKASYGKLNEYLKDLSREYVDSDEECFSPHDFRRLGATKIAKDYLDKELQGVDPKKDRKKWEDRIVKAVIEAAKNLNDKPQTVFDNYIAPNILFATSPDDMLKYFPYLKGQVL